MAIISVARQGQEIGDYNLDGVREGLASGFFLPDDLGWHEGLTEWLPLPEVAAKTGRYATNRSGFTGSTEKEKGGQGSQRAKAPKMIPAPMHDWHLDPATEKAD